MRESLYNERMNVIGAFEDQGMFPKKKGKQPLFGPKSERALREAAEEEAKAKRSLREAEEAAKAEKLAEEAAKEAADRILAIEAGGELLEPTEVLLARDQVLEADVGGVVMLTSAEAEADSGGGGEGGEAVAPSKAPSKSKLPPFDKGEGGAEADGDKK